MKHSLKEQVKGSLVRPLGFRVATGLSPTFKIPLIESVSSVPSGLVSAFTRNSTATYIDVNGLVQTAGINIPRFQNGRYLCEPAATNLIKNSQNLSSWINDWGGGVTLISGLDTIAGLPAFRLIQIGSVGGAMYGGDDEKLSLTAGTKYYASLFIKNLNSVQCSVAFWDIVKSTMNTLTISWTGGVPSTYSNPTTITEITYTKLAGTGEYLVSFAYTVPTGSSTHRFLLFPEVSIVSTNGIIVTGVQLATTLTSYIPTTTTPVTREADALHYDVGDAITQGQGSLYCEFFGVSSVSATWRRVLTLTDGTNTNKVLIALTPAGVGRGEIITGGASEASINSSFIVPQQLNKVALVYRNNSTTFYTNGVDLTPDTSCSIPVNLSKLYIGISEINTYSIGGEIGNIKYFKEVLTPEEAIKLTTV
jgi:hypothetical protein